MAERKRMFEPHATEENCVQVLNLKKVYPSIDGNPPKIAVKGVSFGVKERSCMGILGHNVRNIIFPPTHFHILE